MEFANPALLFLGLAALPLAAAIFARRRKVAHQLPAASGLAGLPSTFRIRLALLAPALRVLALLLAVAGLAGPRAGNAKAAVPAEGIDIALSIDISSSMVTNFFSPDRSRLDVTRQVVRDFIKGRTNDRIGLVVFQNEALALAPPTLDYLALDEMVEGLESGLLPDGTGIGVGLAEALNMLQDSHATSRIVILLTDGEHNAESIRPEEAARVAAALRIRVYTIGVVDDRARGGRGIDEPLLRDIAVSTGARYFVADTAEDLAAVYEEIGRLETSRVGREHYERFTEYGPWLLGAAAIVLLLELLLRGTWLRVMPA